MTNTDQNTITLEQDQWSSKPLNEAQEKSRSAAELIPFTSEGMSPQNFAQVVDFAKHMSHAKGMLGPHLIGNYAGCLAIIELAQQFKMRPFMLARQTYFVNGMIAFDGQAIMSIMNLHMPLVQDEHGNKTRLLHRFEGDKAVYEPIEIEETDRDDRPTGKKIWINKLIKPSTRKIILWGRMRHEATDLVYESPPVFQIKNKKSPLWEEDEDQQLIYWGSRRWQRRHWPEGMLGIIDREEAEQMHLGADNAKLIAASDNPGKALLERIAAAKVQTDDADSITTVREGFHVDHAHNETTNQNGKETKAAVVETSAALDNGDEQGNVPDGKKPKPKTKAEKKAEAEAAKAPAEPEHEVMPNNEAEWTVYCRAWIAATPPQDLMKRWNEERKLRNDCGVVSGENRDSVYETLNNKIHEGDSLTRSNKDL